MHDLAKRTELEELFERQYESKDMHVSVNVDQRSFHTERYEMIFGGDISEEN